MPADPTQADRFFALVPAAGNGSRFGATIAKQYAMIAGMPMLAHTLAALGGVSRLTLVLVALAPDDDEFDRRVDSARGEFLAVARCGGASRALTVSAGLDELARRGARASDWVLVHDAARCLVRTAWIDALIDACRGDAVGGLLAVPVADTLKRDTDGRVAATVPRAGVWHAQTPQMFRLGTLQRALAQAGADVTDESSAIESIGLAPLLVAGSSENLKVTLPGDVAIAEALLKARLQ